MKQRTPEAALYEAVRLDGRPAGRLGLEDVAWAGGVAVDALAHALRYHAGDLGTAIGLEVELRVCPDADPLEVAWRPREKTA